MTRTPLRDPRTVARDIPGIFDSIFPQLTPGIVGHFNRTMLPARCEAVPAELINRSSLQKAMLFELGFAVGEMLIKGNVVDWDTCVQLSVMRQRRHFDAQIPEYISAHDRSAAEAVGKNLACMMSDLANEIENSVVQMPFIPGYQWISSGNGDFSIGSTLIEVKCSGRNFSASDYRQIVMYWLLSFASSLESNIPEWENGILLNPRSAMQVTFKFEEFLRIISGGLSKVEILQLFASMIDPSNRN
jgi:hypothetical protein